MAAEIPPSHRQADSELRASHTDRDEVVEKLRVAAGDGRLTPEELDERLEAALTARTYGELAALIADLPAAGSAVGVAPPQAAELLVFDQWGGNATRTGRWVTPASIEARVVGGDVKLDFTEAQISCPTLPIEANLQGGNLILVVKPGIAVETNHLAMVGGNVKFGKGTDRHDPVVLRVEVSGRLLGGSVVVRLPRRTFRQWLTRKPRPYSTMPA
ncbi:MAG: DUF1707 SHOCT-like domain-containing protein [Streptosporangiaceae bacterium]